VELGLGGSRELWCRVGTMGGVSVFLFFYYLFNGEGRGGLTRARRIGNR
jgi:hypothetical protein